MEETEDELPKVINADEGMLLPDVDVEEKRKYVDYFTFTAYDVSRDAEIEQDKGEYTTDMMGYLISKGYSFVNTLNQGVLINGFKPFFYIHDAGSFYYAGSNANPDTKYLKSILVYDRLIPLADILKECTLMPQYMRNPYTSPFSPRSLRSFTSMSIRRYLSLSSRSNSGAYPVTVIKGDV